MSGKIKSIYRNELPILRAEMRGGVMNTQQELYHLEQMLKDNMIKTTKLTSVYDTLMLSLENWYIKLRIFNTEGRLDRKYIDSDYCPCCERFMYKNCPLMPFGEKCHGGCIDEWGKVVSFSAALLTKYCQSEVRSAIVDMINKISQTAEEWKPKLLD